MIALPCAVFNSFAYRFRGTPLSNPHHGRWFKFNDTSIEPFDMNEHSMEDECFGGTFRSRVYEKGGGLLLGGRRVKADQCCGLLYVWFRRSDSFKFPMQKRYKNTLRKCASGLLRDHNYTHCWVRWATTYDPCNLLRSHLQIHRLGLNGFF